jgi:hypothetical protein
MCELKNGKVFTSKFVGTGPSSYEKRIYHAAVSQKFRNTALGQSRAHVSTSRSFYGIVTSAVTGHSDYVVNCNDNEDRPKITNDIRSDNFYMSISLLISTYSH